MNKKNILFFFTDEQRKDTLGCYGNNIISTPNIDRLAHEGIMFERAYTPIALCTPARASVVTGMVPHRHGLIANPGNHPARNHELDESRIPFSSYLRKAGYQTASIGKWHVGKEKGPGHYEFDGLHYPGYHEPYQHKDYIQYLDEHGFPRFNPRGIIRGTFPNGKPGHIMGGILDQPKEATFTYYLAEKIIEQLRSYAKNYQTDGTPFYIGMNIFGPHLPYYLPEEYANMYHPEDVILPEGFKEDFTNKPMVQKNYSAHWSFDCFNEDEWKKMIAMYWGYCTLIDEQIGRVLAVLEELGLTDETLICFSTDHGSFEGSHRMNDKGPAMYEDIYNIPFIVKGPGMKHRGVINHQFVSLLDLTATFVDVACDEVPEHFDGRSLLPFLKGEDPADWRQEMFAEYHGHQFPYPQRMIRTKHYKLVVNPADINEFYDLELDPAELINQINNESYDHQIKGHFEILYQHLKKSEDTFFRWMKSMYAIGEV